MISKHESLKNNSSVKKKTDSYIHLYVHCMCVHMYNYVTYINTCIIYNYVCFFGGCTWCTKIGISTHTHTHITYTHHTSHKKKETQHQHQHQHQHTRQH